MDRDGVINRAVVRAGRPYPPANMAEMEILPGVLEALESLRKIGYLLIVVTNQPDVARGTMSRAAVEEMNSYLASCLPIDEFRTCFHDTVDHCSCRKPSPGSLIDAAALHGIDLRKSFMVGDRWRDVEAGKRAGCQTIFIDYGYAESNPDQFDYRVSSLLEAVHIILGGGK